jgi:hypothetical protein
MSAIEIDAELKSALTRFRAARPEQSRLERELDAVVLVSDIGGDALLTMDGRLTQDSPFDGVTEIASLFSRRAVLVLGVQRIPELARVLPTRVSGAEDCDPCGGRGWLQVKSDFRIPCPGCGGMGWLDDDMRQELANRASNPAGLRPER